MTLHDEIKQRLEALPEVQSATLGGDFYHVELVVISDAFLNKTKVARQQWVYARLNDLIKAGTLHALSMQTWTNDEWEKQRG